MQETTMSSLERIKSNLMGAHSIVCAIQEKQMVIDFAKHDGRPSAEAEKEKERLINIFYDKMTMLAADTEGEFLTQKHVK